MDSKQVEVLDSKRDEAIDPYFPTRPGSVLRKGKWKLHHYFENDSVLLFDLQSDLGEKNNVIQTYPEVAASLLSELNDWREEQNVATIFQPNPEYDESYQIVLDLRK